ncbi:MAG: ATP-binding cassette domain-containing protein [Kofleriaceae bacterium]|nr:ATP-binding cassette domain-containing protein [Kofleriaceae bacterium]
MSAPPPPAPGPALVVRASKRFGERVALRDARLEVAPGTVHAVVGENGAGKSTLLRVVYGLCRADAGQLELGAPCDLARHDVARAQALGVGMVHQHGMLVPTLTLAENAALGHERRRRGLLDLDAARAELARSAARLGQTLAPDARAGALSHRGEQQAGRDRHGAGRAPPPAHPGRARTALLAPGERRAPAGAPGKARRRGRGGGAGRPQRLDEELADRRRHHRARAGQPWPRSAPAARRRAARWPPPDRGRARAAAGTRRARRLADAPRERSPPTGWWCESAGSSAAQRPAIGRGGRGGAAGGGVRGVSLAVRRGEVVGIAGVEGNGQRELVHALVGLATPAAGTITLDGAAVTRATVAARRRAGLAHVAEDRHRHGLVLDATVGENVLLGRLDEVARRGAIDRARAAALAAATLAEGDVRPPDAALPARALSGGNQQKLVVARELGRPGVRAVVAAHPTRGVDLAAQARIHDRLRAIAAHAAVQVVSADLDELLALCHRVVVLHRGAFAGELAGDALRADDARARLGGWMVGA